MQYIITSNLKAMLNTPRPLRGDLTNAEFRDKIKVWNDRNEYEIFVTSGVKDGDVVEGQLRGGILYITEKTNK